jgi:toxin CcdB
MAQFDAHRNPIPLDSGHIPLVLDVQSDFLDILPTRIVVPLIRAEQFRNRIHRLHPEFLVHDQRLIMVTTEAGVLPRSALGPAVASLLDRRYEIIGAIDMLITGV